MGRSFTPKYRLETEGGDLHGPIGWRGRATPGQLEKYIIDMCNSSKIGGCNEHIGRMLGRIMNPPRIARIVNQSTGQVVAEWKHPPFLVM